MLGFCHNVIQFLFALQEMAVRALKQTGSRSIEAALEYISKMSYLDPRNEQIVRVIKQTSPGEHDFFFICVLLSCNKLVFKVGSVLRGSVGQQCSTADL